MQLVTPPVGVLPASALVGPVSAAQSHGGTAGRARYPELCAGNIQAVCSPALGHLPSHVTSIRVSACTDFRRCFFELRLSRFVPAGSR